MADQKPATDPDRQREIEAVFEHMGLIDPRVRAQFDSDESMRVPLTNLRVVVSSSSDPFSR
jgi:hypothetical protein